MTERKLVNSRQAQRAQTRGKIVEAWTVVFARSGYRAASLDQIATEAGISRTLLLYYFPSKAALLDEYLVDYTRLITAVADRLEADVETGNTTAAPTALSGIVDALIAHPRISGWIGIDIGALTLDSPGAKSLTNQGTRLRALLAHAIGGPDAELLASAAIGAVVRPFTQLPHEHVAARRDMLAAAGQQVLIHSQGITAPAAPARVPGHVG